MIFRISYCMTYSTWVCDSSITSDPDLPTPSSDGRFRGLHYILEDHRAPRCLQSDATAEERGASSTRRFQFLTSLHVESERMQPIALVLIRSSRLPSGGQAFSFSPHGSCVMRPVRFPFLHLESALSLATAWCSVHCPDTASPLGNRARRRLHTSPRAAAPSHPPFP